MYPRPGSNRHGFKGQGILSPSCLPIPPLRHLHKKSRLYSGPCGAENETRTRDPDLGKVVLYQLSYFRFASRIGVFVATRHNQTSFASALAAPKTPLSFANCAAKVQLFSIPQAINEIFFYRFSNFLISFSFIKASTGVKVSMLVFRMSSLI